MSAKALWAAAALSLAFAAQAAHADGVGATFAINYFKVAAGTDPDFPGGGTPIVLAGSSLGVNGLPVGANVNDIVSGQIAWWNPALNSHVIADGTGTVSLPFDVAMYAPHGTGINDNAFFETAVLSGNFTLAAPSTISFHMGSDDDSFLYVDGVLFGQNPGIHSISAVDFTSPLLGLGSHTIELFYADRQHTGAELSLSLNSQGIVITPTGGVPEPATWGLMILGFAGLGASLRRARAKGLATA